MNSQITKRNYFTVEANSQYMSVSQLKAFKTCEASALAEIKNQYRRPDTKALLMGSYVDAYFSGELEEFTANNPEIFKKNGELKADYEKCNDIIMRAQKDPLFMEFVSGGDPQVVMTGEIAGVPFKIKIDSLHEDKIVDLKLMRDMEPIYKDGERRTFLDAWEYPLQGFVYQEIVRQNTGEKLPFYLAVLTKQDEPDMELIQIPDWRLETEKAVVEHYAPIFAEIKSGAVEPKRCESCAYCRSTKTLSGPKAYEELIKGLEG